MNRVVVIGSGNVAYHLARVFAMSDSCELVQVVSRSKVEGQKLSASCGAAWGAIDGEIIAADYYILALRDDVVVDIADWLMPKFASGSIVCHTSGSLPLIVCKRGDIFSARFYPLQTFTRGVTVDFKNITIFIESKSVISSKKLVALSRYIAMQGVEVEDKTLKTIHLAATFANNFTNRMYHHAQLIVESAGVSMEVLYPLIEEGVRKLVVSKLSPRELQTGAAARGDSNIINEHRALLEGSNLELYDVITKDILNDKF